MRRLGIALLAVTAVSSPAVAGADPMAPRPDTACASTLADVMTWLPDAATALVCAGQRWQVVAQPYPVSDRWLSYGPAVQLHGQGRRNPSMLSGEWTATPMSPESRCHAEQVAVVPGTPTIGPPRVDDGEPGRPLIFDVAPTMATIEISGNCLWQKTGSDQPPSGW